MKIFENTVSSEKLINPIFTFLSRNRDLYKLRTFFWTLPSLFWCDHTVLSAWISISHIFSMRIGGFINGYCSLHRPVHFFQIKGKIKHTFLIMMELAINWKFWNKMLPHYMDEQRCSWNRSQVSVLLWPDSKTSNYNLLSLELLVLGQTMNVTSFKAETRYFILSFLGGTS